MGGGGGDDLVLVLMASGLSSRSLEACWFYRNEMILNAMQHNQALLSPPLLECVPSKLFK